MSQRENLFRPIHKGIRSMIYELGRRLGTTEFTNDVEAKAIAKELKDDLAGSVSGCILCLLRAHSTHEEKDFFGALSPFDPDAGELMMGEHRNLSRAIHELGKTCDEVLEASDPARRVELGDRLNLEANDLFALYLGHLKNEESTLVQVMWERFTVAQLRSLRAQFYNQIPLARFELWMRWTLPALNLNELTVLLSGMKTDPEPNRFRDAMRIAAETLPAGRMALVSTNVGL